MAKEKQFRSAIAQYMSNAPRNTELRRAACINALSEFIGGKPLREVTPRQALAFFGELKRRNLADRTIKNTYYTLSAIYAFGVDMGLVTQNPIRAIKRSISWAQMRDVRPTKYIKFTEVPSIMDSIHPGDRLTLGSQKIAVRNRALVGILFGCGLRRSEAQSLCVGDVHVENGGTMYVSVAHSKSGKPRRVALNPWTWEHLSLLVLQRRKEAANTRDALFPFYYSSGKARAAMSTASIYRVYRQYVGAAPHSARKTFATQLVKGGASYKQVAAALGHSGIAQIPTYEACLTLEESPVKNVGYY